MCVCACVCVRACMHTDTACAAPSVSMPSSCLLSRTTSTPSSRASRCPCIARSRTRYLPPTQQPDKCKTMPFAALVIYPRPFLQWPAHVSWDLQLLEKTTGVKSSTSGPEHKVGDIVRAQWGDGINTGDGEWYDVARRKWPQARLLTSQLATAKMLSGSMGLVSALVALWRATKHLRAQPWIPRRKLWVMEATGKRCYLNDWLGCCSVLG